MQPKLRNQILAPLSCKYIYRSNNPLHLPPTQNPFGKSMVQIRLFGKNSGESLRLVDLLRSEMQAQLRIRSSSEPRESKETSDYQGPGRRSISEDSGKKLSAGPPTRKYSLSCGSIHRETHVTVSPFHPH